MDEGHVERIAKSEPLRYNTGGVEDFSFGHMCSGHSRSVIFAGILSAKHNETFAGTRFDITR